MLKEFKEFALRGNAIDMAIGIIVGGAFGTIVKSLVDDVLMPPLGVLIGGIDFSNFFLILKNGNPPGPYLSLNDAKAAGATTLNYGLFLNHLVSFLIVSFAVFLLVKMLNTIHKKEKTAAAIVTKECPFCASTIPIKASRCPHCTSDLT
ncbi:MAG TPA: large conductance mechanosensitive channel protein MscL [Candidatus Hydrogenedentes bacterium]|nr:large conductance mechanosensitive channel protein MscL [Candidatus Hydrogenedentota bacterium]HOL78278.1 large conductance mechanosensitive channel protein MscL [Candidatus Hydrogenedentota bacterium]HPO87461.1 large conductance mechanosensitive channel protein MscL [Candidatus Hydrogenedentota bacterium]